MPSNNNNDGRGNFGNTKQHQGAGHQGGEETARTHDQAFYSQIGEKGGKAAQDSGHAHTLTDDERARGGENSHQTTTARKVLRLQQNRLVRGDFVVHYMLLHLVTAIAGTSNLTANFGQHQCFYTSRKQPSNTGGNLFC